MQQAFLEEERLPDANRELLQLALARCKSPRVLECRHNRDYPLQIGPGESIGIVEDGIGAVALVTQHGQARGTELVKPGSVIGIARIAQSFPSTTVLFSAITDARLLLFDYEDFCAALDSDPAMMRLLFSQLQQRFLVAVEQCLIFSSEADQAVAFTLHSLAEALGNGRSSEVAVKLPVVREQIAMLSGKSVPSANRALQRLRRQGKVRLDRATITVPGEFRIASSERRWLWQG
ncbi:Crp/Fnr family transcriptional regulator [Carboxydochorda subterranea]|uniref:Crp/Fnr family transcriptional regulator n=1 Tax=Carboxydichorda subterranea TaxID=3109565 RepID=A0ABZ1BXK0_9FIRM|nr:Crp/Fnr family transcriptional regulator [Limnochorda sp. L945t]WRP17479.1 Crp/Fnr family transcriptional regulator [Limnochorda sp. L945t]